MGLFKNTQDGQIQTAHGATADWLLNQQPEGLWVEIEVEDPGELKGKALDEALEAADLPKSGNVDAKRARLAEYNAQQLAQETGPSPDAQEGQPPAIEVPSQDQQ